MKLVHRLIEQRIQLIALKYDRPTTIEGWEASIQDLIITETRGMSQEEKHLWISNESGTNHAAFMREWDKMILLNLSQNDEIHHPDYLKNAA